VHLKDAKRLRRVSTPAGFDFDLVRKYQTFPNTLSSEILLYLLDEPGCPRMHSSSSCGPSLYVFKLVVYSQCDEESECEMNRWREFNWRRPDSELAGELIH
jgi:hypothetical protein